MGVQCNMFSLSGPTYTSVVTCKAEQAADLILISLRIIGMSYINITSLQRRLLQKCSKAQCKQPCARLCIVVFEYVASEDVLWSGGSVTVSPPRGGAGQSETLFSSPALLSEKATRAIHIQSSSWKQQTCLQTTETEHA